MKKKILFGIATLLFTMIIAINVNLGMNTGNESTLFNFKASTAQAEGPMDSCNTWCGSGSLCVLNNPSYPIFCYGWQAYW